MRVSASPDRLRDQYSSVAQRLGAGAGIRSRWPRCRIRMGGAGGATGGCGVADGRLEAKPGRTCDRAREPTLDAGYRAALPDMRAKT